MRVVKFDQRQSSPLVLQLWNVTILDRCLCFDSARYASRPFSNVLRDSNKIGAIMDQEKKFDNPKLGWTFEELAKSLSVSVPFLRLEVKRGRLKAARLGRRVVLLDGDVQRYVAEATHRAA
jgi:excisionase family DNA binding protein